MRIRLTYFILCILFTVGAYSQNADSVVLKEYYNNGNIKYVIYAKDSVLDKELSCRELHKSYYPNGKLEEVGCQGYFGPW